MVLQRLLNLAESHLDLMVVAKDLTVEISATCLDQAEIFSQPYLVVQGSVMAQICKQRLQLDLKIPFMALN